LMTCCEGRRSEEGPRLWRLGGSIMLSGALPDRAASQSPRHAPAHHAQFAARSRKFLAPTRNTYSRVRLKPTVICKMMLWSPPSEVAPESAGDDLSNLHTRCSLYARRHDRLFGSVSSNISHGEERRRPLAPHERRAALPGRADSAPHFLRRGCRRITSYWDWDRDLLVQ
jgi:hypothetical protein